MMPHREQSLNRPIQDPLHAKFHCVEFALNRPHPIYQFKLWRTAGNNVFLLIKDSSEILPQLKVGSVVPMKYMTGNAIANNEVHDTQIKRIVNEQQGRFQGHCRVELAILAGADACSVH